jgi:hypothetical protein
MIAPVHLRRDAKVFLKAVMAVGGQICAPTAKSVKLR